MYFDLLFFYEQQQSIESAQTRGDRTEDFVGKFSRKGMVCHCLVNSHLSVLYSESFLPPAYAIFFLSCTASLRSSSRRPVAFLMLSSHRIRGFPCFQCPSTCPSIMSRSRDLVEDWGPERSLLSCIIAGTKETQHLSYILLFSSRACYQHCWLMCS